MKFSPRLARNYLIKGAREGRVQWERELVQGIRDGRRANLREEILKRSGAGQETDVKMA